MKSYFDQDYSEDIWRSDAYASELAERDREQRELEADQHADFYAGDSPELTAFYDATTPDAPGGRYIERTWEPIDATTAGPIVPECNAEPIYFGMELSTTEMLARMSTRGRRTKRVRRAA